MLKSYQAGFKKLNKASCRELEPPQGTCRKMFLDHTALKCNGGWDLRLRGLRSACGLSNFHFLEYVCSHYFVGESVSNMDLTFAKPPLKIKQLIALAVIAYVLAVAIRLGEIPKWGSPDYKIDGEYILATHDSYHWLAGAENFEFGQGHPMARFLAVLHSITDLPLGDIGFWLPPFTASLVAAVMVVWAAALGARCAGISAGLLACFAPGFLARTLLGFCDTDLVTLLFSLLLGLAPALWLRPWLSSPLLWLKGRGQCIVHGNPPVAVVAVEPESGGLPRQAPDSILSRPWLAALALSGLFGFWTKEWHSLFSYLVLWYALALPLLIALFASRESGARPALWRGAAVYILPLLFGLWGLLGAAVLAYVLITPGTRGHDFLWRRSGLYALWAGLLLLILGLCLSEGVLEALLRLVGSYVKRDEDPAAMNMAAQLVYPGVAQSIIEIQDLKGVKELLAYFYPAWQVSLLGIIGFVVLAVVSPLAIFHAPLLLLALFGMKLGGRMVMFGAPGVALGLAVPLAWLLDYVLYYGVFFNLRRYIRRQRARALRFFRLIPWTDVLLLILIVPYISLVPRMSQGPMMRVEQAEALRELAVITPEDATIWVWWDFGYAVQYFAQRHTIADGARHGGVHLYLPAAVYSTDNPHFAAQLIKYTANVDSGEEQTAAPGTETTPEPTVADKANAVFAGLSGEEAQHLVDSWAGGHIKLKDKDKPQYLVVSFDILRLGYWISNYGNWNFALREGKGYNISSISQALQYSVDDGIVSVTGRDPVEADSLDILNKGGLDRYSYYRYNDRHFVFNNLSGDKLVLSDGLYNSLMVQMLLSPADDPRFHKDFKLVFDNTYCRVYKIQ